MKTAEETEDTGAGKARHSFFDLQFLFQQRLWPVRLAVISAALAGIVLLGVFFVSYTSRLYASWHQTRLLRDAATMLQQGKLNEATQTAREVVAKHPNSLPALYVLAEAAEKQNLEEAITWRSRIARLLPKDADSQLNLVSASLRFGNLDLARKALDQVPASDRDRAVYHVVSGWLARAEGNFAGQEQQFAAAVMKEPGNDLYQFNLAALQIHSSDRGKNTKARENLERLSKLSPYRTGALRALLDDAVARNELSAADNFAQQLQMSPEVTFGDYLLCLKFYRKLDEKKFRSSLERVKPFATRSSSDLASLMEWMNQNGFSSDVIKWTDKLPAQKLTSPRVAVAVADAFANSKNWTHLKRWTRKGAWGESDYVRVAYQAIATRQLRQESTDSEFRTLWHSAVQSANYQAEREIVLARLASKWNLEKESEQLWLRVSENPPLRREALDALRQLYRGKNDLEKLYDVLQRLHESSPNEAPITTDLARLGLNLERNVELSHALAKEAHHRAPNDTDCAVTYAFSLYRLGRSTEGLPIIQGLPDDELHDPHAAVYVALLLADAGQVNAAKSYLTAATGGIYPEEKKVLDQTKKKIEGASTLPSPTASPVSVQPSPAPAASPH
jgi:Tfp pilus assembly protein PilF